MSNTENTQDSARLFERRVPRLKLHFPVQIEVVVHDSQPHRFEGRTIEVSRYGATLECHERVAIEVAVNLTLPFGGPYLAQVNGIWMEEETGLYRLSTKLLDPPEWTAPNKTHSEMDDDAEQLRFEPRTHYLLSAYQEYLQEIWQQEPTMEQIAQRLLKKALRVDTQFQQWMTDKIMEDLQSWKEEMVTDPSAGVIEVP